MWIFSSEMPEDFIKRNRLKIGSKILTSNDISAEVINKTNDYITIRIYESNYHFDRKYKIINKIPRVKKIKLIPRE